MKMLSVEHYNAGHLIFTNKHNAVSVIFKDFVFIKETQKMLSRMDMHM